MTTSPRPVAEYHDVDYRRFLEEIQPQYQPAILKGFVDHWPAVQHAKRSASELCLYIADRDTGTPVQARLIPAEAEGRSFYTEDMSRLNFQLHQVPISAVLAQLAHFAQAENPPSVVVQCAAIEKALPRFALENTLPFSDIECPPMIWIGNRSVTAAHFDGSENLACVVTGRRRFTMFPPEQIANLYIGPIEFGPATTPVSLVDFKRPDFEKFPRFKQALETAVVAELEPGDALYMPSLWWHHVESFDKLNIMINYWWNILKRVEGQTSTAFDCMVHCIKNMKNLRPEHKKAWAAMFRHYVFNTEYDPAEHIPAHRRGILKQVE